MLRSALVVVIASLVLNSAWCDGATDVAVRMREAAEKLVSEPVLMSYTGETRTYYDAAKVVRYTTEGLAILPSEQRGMLTIRSADRTREVQPPSRHFPVENGRPVDIQPISVRVMQYRDVIRVDVRSTSSLTLDNYSRQFPTWFVFIRDGKNTTLFQETTKMNGKVQRVGKILEGERGQSRVSFYPTSFFRPLEDPSSYIVVKNSDERILLRNERSELLISPELGFRLVERTTSGPQTILKQSIEGAIPIDGFALPERMTQSTSSGGFELRREEYRVREMRRITAEEAIEMLAFEMPEGTNTDPEPSLGLAFQEDVVPQQF
jgi:hypothetical protein